MRPAATGSPARPLASYCAAPAAEPPSQWGTNAAVLATVKGKARRRYAPPLTFTARDGKPVTGRDGGTASFRSNSRTEGPLAPQRHGQSPLQVQTGSARPMIVVRGVGPK